jgi:NAD(P)H-dependent FMN reductase
MKILSFGASTSSQSINRQLARYAASQVPGAAVTDLDLRSYDLPIYSSDEEESNGIPADAQAFLDAIRDHDAVVVSLAEHNGSYAAAFKNLYDWTSRIEQKLWSEKPMLLLSTSPGGRAGISVMEAAKEKFPRMGADLRATFSLPSFYENFSAEEGVTDPGLAVELDEAIQKLGAS